MSQVPENPTKACSIPGGHERLQQGLVLPTKPRGRVACSSSNQPLGVLNGNGVQHVESTAPKAELPNGHSHDKPLFVPRVLQIKKKGGIAIRFGPT